MLLDTRDDALLARGTKVRDNLDADRDARHAEDVPIAEELLVEEVSIDGMCGVY